MKTVFSHVAKAWIFPASALLRASDRLALLPGPSWSFPFYQISWEISYQVSPYMWILFVGFNSTKRSIPQLLPPASKAKKHLSLISVHKCPGGNRLQAIQSRQSIRCTTAIIIVIMTVLSLISLRCLPFHHLHHSDSGKRGTRDC